MTGGWLRQTFTVIRDRPWGLCGLSERAIHSHRTVGDSRLVRVEGMNIKRRKLKIGGQYFEVGLGL
jgi:hypothetical protein